MYLQTPQSYTLPDLIALCPFKWSNNPHYARTRAESSAWINSFNLFVDSQMRAFFTASDSERLCAYAYPYAEYDALRIACDFVNLLFMLDEISDEQSGEGAKETGQTFLNIMNDIPGDSSELSRLSQDFKDRFIKIASPRTRRQFTERCTAYLNAVAHEAKLREEQVVLDPEAYMAVRRENSAVRTTLSIASICLNVDLPDEALEDPIFMKLHFAAVDMVCWSNDLYSYDMEQAKGHIGNNILTVLMKKHDISLQDAADMVGVHFTSLIRQFNEDKATLLKFKPDFYDQVKHHIDAMECWVAGNLYWSFHSRRYFGDRHERIMRTRVVDLTPRVSVS